jgi:hypothetical protein
MESDMQQLWVIQPDREQFPSSNVKVVLWANGREEAKRQANAGWLSGMGNPDYFICTPITNPGDRVKLDITLNV